MILGFKPQFRDKILSGTKIHTIREDKHNRWKPGIVIHGATGVRTKYYNQFFKDYCRSTQRISISFNVYNNIEIVIDGRLLFGASEKEALANNDGFDSWESFDNWFRPLINKSEFLCYQAKLIHWTDFTY